MQASTSFTLNVTSWLVRLPHCATVIWILIVCQVVVLCKEASLVLIVTTRLALAAEIHAGSGVKESDSE
jgi:hypothetical protein